MTIGSLAPGAVSFLQSTDRMVAQRRSIDHLQQQMATGRKSQTFSGLGIDRRISLDARSKISAMEGFRAGIVDGRQRVKLMTNALSQMNKTVTDTRGELVTQPFQPSPAGKLRVQESAMQRLSLAIDLLNTDHNGRYLFSGLAQDTRPVENAKFLIDGGDGFPGLRALARERAEAELGVNLSSSEKSMGRLEINQQVAEGDPGESLAIVDFGQQHGVGFGFTLDRESVSIEADSRIDADFDSENNSWSFEIRENLQPGDSIKIAMSDRFGGNENYEYTFELMAADEVTKPGEFLIGADEVETAANMMHAMKTAVSNLAHGALAPRAQAHAIEQYFENPAEFRRPSFDPEDDDLPNAAWNASELNAIDPDLAPWYKGDVQVEGDTTPEGLSARATATLRIDDNQVVGIGARANETPFRDMLVAFSQLEILRFENTPEGKQAFEDLADRNADRLNFAPGSGLQAIGHQIASAEVAMRDADERHKVGVNMLMDMVDGVEEISKEEVAARILATQNRLEASYQTTAMLSRLTLLNYL